MGIYHNRGTMNRHWQYLKYVLRHKWYLANRDNMHLHPDTRVWLEKQLEIESSIEAL